MQNIYHQKVNEKRKEKFDSCKIVDVHRSRDVPVLKYYAMKTYGGMDE
jgi:hypothetical protein